MPWGAAHFVVFEIVVALAAMLGLGHVLARLLRRLSQPPVIGQMLAGMMLGPSVLGWLGRRYFGWERGVWLSDEAVAGLGWLAELGAMSYLFLMGVEFDGSCARMRWRQAAWIALAGTVVPLLMGLAMAFGMHRLLAPPPVHPASFALFFGVALSVTAFPVLARILQERELLATPLGQLALACAAVADLAAWCLLASVVGLVHAQKEQVAAVPLRVTLYLAAMLLVARPVLRGLDRWAAAGGRKDAAMGGTLVVATLAIVGSHLAGLHGLFGAFFCGVLVPHNGSIAQRLVAGRVQRLSGWLLPAFFAHAGLRLELALVHGLADWLLWMLIVGAATAGKLLATAATARLVGLDAWTSGALGILMNTRGLVELIVLRVGLELGVLTPRLYAMLVLMALITTLSTGPLMAGWNHVCRS
jgi:Kef-type K+ transport system membrane component KefB